MRRVTLRSLWAHKRRLVSTVVAVVLGVAFMAGTFIMSTTLQQSFDDLFSQVVAKTDVVVQGQVLFSDLLTGDQRANLPATVVDDIAAVPGVAAAAPRVTTAGSFSVDHVIGRNGKEIGGGQGVTVLEDWIQEDAINPFTVTSGRPPAADDEVVLNVAAVEEGHLSVGDRVHILTRLGDHGYKLVGVFGLGAAKSAGGAVSVGMTLTEAQRVTGLDGSGTAVADAIAGTTAPSGQRQVSSVWVKARPGVSSDELVQRIKSQLKVKADVVTEREAAAQMTSDSQTNLGFLELALAIFGAIALLVGIFVISNTFSILVAQRTKELALLRALGASRGQVLGSVLLEAGVVGLIAAVLGLGAGLLLARGVMAGLEATGASLPSTHLVVAPATILLSLAIGVAVTLLASLMPAIRATRVPPLAALRDIAVDRSNLSRARIAIGVVGLLAGVYGLSGAWRSGGETSSLPGVGLGAGLVVVSFLVVGPVLAGRSVRLLGLPLPRFKGVTGRLATENAARSPKRTSATASAVVIGVALVVWITVFAASATKSVHSEIDRGFKADFVVSGKSSGLTFVPGIPATVADIVRGADGVGITAAFGFGSVAIRYPDGDTATHFATTADPAGLAAVFEPRMVKGSVSGLTDDAAFIDVHIAKQHHIELGDVIQITAGGGGTTVLRVAGIGDDPNLLGFVTMTRDAFKKINPQLVDVQVAGTLAPGADLKTVLAGLRHDLKGTPGVQVLDRDGFIGSIVDQITAYITIVYGLLVLSIITALVGIANTLSLSITERTRELGLLRAVGMDRSGVRSSVRWEASLISALGALVGVLMGLLLSVAIVQALKGFGLASFAFPTGGLVVIVVVTAVLGTLAAVRPARRAAGLSILDAIATE